MQRKRNATTRAVGTERALAAVLVSIFLVASPRAVVAKTESACDGKLIQDVLTTQSNDLVKIAALKLLSTENYSTVRNNVGGSYDGFGADLDQANQNTEKLAEQNNYHEDQVHSKGLLWRYVSDNGLAAYRACLETLDGLYVYASDVTDSGFYLKGIYDPRNGDPPRQIAFSGYGADLPATTDALTGRTPLSYSIKRDPTKEVRISVNTIPAGYVSSVLIPVPLPEPPPTQSPQYVVCPARTQQIEFFNSGSIGNHDPHFTFYAPQNPNPPNRQAIPKSLFGLRQTDQLVSVTFSTPNPNIVNFRNVGASVDGDNVMVTAGSDRKGSWTQVILQLTYQAFGPSLASCLH